jgi:hypothetical protein
MEFLVDRVDIKYPDNDRFTVDGFSTYMDVVEPRARKVVFEENDGYCYSAPFPEVIEKKQLFCTKTGKTIDLTEEELEWLINVKKFMSKYQFIIEQDLSE